jgi:hypothetical protein
LERVSGSITGNRTQALASYNAGNGVAQIFKKNIEKNSVVDTVVRLGLVTRFSLEAGAGYRSRNFSATEYAPLEYTQKRINLGLFYQPSPALRLGLSPRVTKIEFPRYSLVNGVYLRSESRRTDLDLTGRWVPNGVSSFDARLSAGRSKLTNGIGRDFSGATGQFSWNWKPTAKWSLITSVSRDTGLETSFLNIGTTGLTADQNRLTNALQFTANYELTSKIALSAAASMARTSRVDEILDQRLNNFDRDSSVSLSARYQLSRGAQLSCQFGHQARGSSTPQYVYSANSFGCAGQLLID